MSGGPRLAEHRPSTAATGCERSRFAARLLAGLPPRQLGLAARGRHAGVASEGSSGGDYSPPLLNQ